MATTTNYVQKSSDGTAVTHLSDSLIFDNATSVGIGTNSPSASTALHILSSNAQLRLDGGTTQSAILQLYNSVSGSGRRNWDIITEIAAAGDFAIRESTSAGGAPSVARLYIDNAGNVGLGTTGPAAALHVLSGSAQLRLDGGATQSAILQLYNSVSGSGRRNWDILTEALAAGDFAIRESTSAGGAPSTVRLYIDNAGNVGIGTSGPDSLLHVAGVSHITGQIFNAAVPTDGSAVYVNNIVYNPSGAAGITPTRLMFIEGSSTSPVSGMTGNTPLALFVLTSPHI